MLFSCFAVNQNVLLFNELSSYSPLSGPQRQIMDKTYYLGLLRYVLKIHSNCGRLHALFPFWHKGRAILNNSMGWVVFTVNEIWSVITHKKVILQVVCRRRGILCLCPSTRFLWHFVTRLAKLNALLQR